MEYSSVEEHKRTPTHPDPDGLQRAQSVKMQSPDIIRKQFCVLNYISSDLHLMYYSWKQIILIHMSNTAPNVQQETTEQVLTTQAQLFCNKRKFICKYDIYRILNVVAHGLCDAVVYL